MNADQLNSNSIVVELVEDLKADVGEALKRLAPMIGQNYKVLTDNDIQEIFNSPNLFLIIARDTENSQIIGMITLLVIRTPYVKKSSIEDLIVEEAYRGRHIGTMLMERAMLLAREKGAAHIDLTSRPQREASNNLYAAMGFQKRETNVYRKIIDYGEV